MQSNNNYFVPKNSNGNIQDYREYQIDRVIYNVNRDFNGNNTIKELLLKRILCDNLSLNNW